MVLFFNILFILGFWDSCQCHQTTQPNSSSPPISSKNPNLTGKQKQPSSVPVSTINPHLTPPIVNSSSTPEQPTSPPLPQPAPIVSELEAQLPIRQFLSIFVVEFLEKDPSSRGMKLIQQKRVEQGKIKKLESLLAKQNGIDKAIGEVMLRYIQENEKKIEGLGAKIQGVVQQQSNLGEKEDSELAKMNQWLTICFRFNLGVIEDKTSALTKDEKLPFAHVLNLIFLIWEEFQKKDTSDRLQWIQFFSQIRARELISLASIWLDDFLEDKQEDLLAKIEVAEFCATLNEKELQDVILSWMRKLKKELNAQAKVNHDTLIIAIELSRAQFLEKIFPVSKDLIKQEKIMNFIDTYFSQSELPGEQSSDEEQAKKVNIALGLRQILEKSEKAYQKLEVWLKAKDRFIKDLVEKIFNYRVMYIIQYYFQSQKSEFVNAKVVYFDQLKTSLSRFSKNPLPLDHSGAKFVIMDFREWIGLIEATKFFITRLNLKFQDLPEKLKEVWDSLKNTQEEYTHYIIVAYMVSGDDNLIETAKKMIQDQLESSSLKDSIGFLKSIHECLKKLDLNNTAEFFKHFKSIHLEKFLKLIQDLLLSNEPGFDKLEAVSIIAHLELYQVDQGQEWIKQFFITDDLFKKVQAYAPSITYLEGLEEWIVYCSSSLTSF